MPQVLDIHRVIEMTGAKRSTIYLWISRGYFPRPLQLGPRRVGWLAADITEWINSRTRTVPRCAA